jgi:hypothetical protein
VRFHSRAGQAPYGYANAVCDQLCVRRRAAGLPALSLQWGPVGGVGYVAETLKARRSTLAPVFQAAKHAAVEAAADYEGMLLSPVRPDCNRSCRAADETAAGFAVLLSPDA